MRKTFLVVPMLTAFVLLAAPALYAQGRPEPTTASDENLQLLRRDLRSTKKQVVAANLPLTDTEAEKFWPVYEQYAAEIIKVYDARYGLIKEYSASFHDLTDVQAGWLAKRWMDLDGALAQLRLKYLPLFEKVLSGRKTALFFQIEMRLTLIIDTHLTSGIPLIQPQ